MAYLNLHEIKEIHLELTTNCNAACPQCARNIYGAWTNPRLPKAELSFTDIKNIFTPDFAAQLSHVMFCGVYGDPITSETSLPAVKYLKEAGVPSIWFYTNGSARTGDWWEAMAQYINGPRDRLIFSVDGLEDTNQLYRRKTNWQKIQNNMRAFIAAGGSARWDFLVFEHNQHQIGQAQALAQELGFRDFRIRKTSRFSVPLRGEVARGFPVLDTSEAITADAMIELIHKSSTQDLPASYWLEQPTQGQYQNVDTTIQLKNIIEEYGDFQNYMKQANVNCIYKNKFRRLYISALAKLWPCCYIPGDLYTWQKIHKYRDDIHKNVLKKYGEEFNDLRKYPIAKILNHPWFSHDLENSWNNAPTDAKNPKLLKCARTCGHKFNPILSQTQDISLEKPGGQKIL